MRAKRKAVIGLLATVTALLTVGFLYRPTHWSDVTTAPPTPTVPHDAQPVHVHTIQLPPLPGFRSPKPVVAADPTGNVAVVAYGIPNDSGSDILAWHSCDRGSSWAMPANLTGQASAGEVSFDPWLVTDRRGRFYCIHSRTSDGRPRLWRSRDGGLTWSETPPIESGWCDRPVVAISSDGRRIAVAVSLSEKTDQFPMGPLNGDDPDLRAKMEAATRQSGGIFLSEDYGNSWKQLASPFDDEHAIPFAAALDDSGRIAATWIVAGDGSRSVITVSDRQGQRWVETPLVKAVQADREHPFNGERFPVLALDGRSSLHVAYVSAGATALMMRQSCDWRTWNDARPLSSDSAEEVRMAALNACGGMVHVTWMERVGASWHTYYCGSRDYGVTWSDAQCLSAEVSLPDGTTAKGFQINSDDDQSSVFDDGTGRAHAVWGMRGGRVAHAIVEWSP